MPAVNAKPSGKNPEFCGGLSVLARIVAICGSAPAVPGAQT